MSYVLEFKYTKDETVDLKELAKTAIRQIEDRKYDAEINGEVTYIGLAHCQKDCQKDVEIDWKEKVI